MSNVSPKLQNSTDEQLWNLINESSPAYASLASDELTRRNFKKLQETISVFNAKSAEQTEKMISLTKGIFWLTVSMLIGLTVQIYIAWK